MAKRQQRIPVSADLPSSVKSLINSACTLVKTDNSVIFVKVISVGDTTLTVKNARGARQTISASEIRELIVDSHA